MVEHNLAKVGVASSNLVSRSIFLFFFFLFSPHSLFCDESIYLEKTYCVEQEALKASFFGYHGKNDPLIITIPKERVNFSVPASSLLNAFTDNNISDVDSSEGGVVIFKRNCSLMGKSELIEAAFMKKFQELSPFVLIDTRPRISIKTSLPADFKRYELVGIQIADAMLKKNSGSFIAVFRVGDKDKKLFFAYEMGAQITVFKAKRNLHNGKILNTDDYETVIVSLDALPNRALVGELSPNIVVKGSIKEGQIFSDFNFDTKKAVHKKSMIKALLKDEGLVIEVQATLLDDANIGDIVKIKTEQGKVLNAKIISTHEAIILE